MQRILLIQLKRLGDVILTAPAVASLRAAMPGAELVMICTAGAGPLARMTSGLDRVIEYRRGKPNLRAWVSAIAGPWDACLDFTGTDRAALMMRASRAARRIAFEKFATNKLRRGAATEFCAASVRGLHTVDFQLALIRELAPACGREERTDVLSIPDAARSSVNQRLRAAGVTGAFAVVHPGTAREEKFWPHERWAEVIGALCGEFSLPVVLTGGDDGVERSHLARIRETLRVPVVDLSGQLDLPELAALISRCQIALGVDSMAMHLAAMFTRRQVVIFGPTNPFHWRPLHDRAAVLQGGGEAPVAHFLPKAPRHGMKEVSTRAVVGAIRDVLQRDGRTGE